jgi:hypothetical protein
MAGKIALLAPSAAMALMTLVVLLTLGLRRFAAVRNRVVSVKYYTTYTEGAEPEALRRHTRHVQNHFEVPPLFHLVVFGTYLVGQVDALTLVVAWFFVASRLVHSVIHLGHNNVSHRFLVFGLGVLAVLFLWVRLVLTIVA